MPDDEPWQLYVIDGKIPDCWNNGLPGIHVIREWNDDTYRIALSASRVRWLREYHFQIRSERYDVSQPREGEIRVQGKYTAEKKAEYRVIKSAMDAMNTVHGRGLYHHLLRSTANMRVQMSMACLLLSLRMKVSNEIKFAIVILTILQDRYWLRFAGQEFESWPGEVPADGPENSC